MGSRATLLSTVNMQVPAERRSKPAEEGRGPVVPPQGVLPKLQRAAYQEKGISIKDQDHSRRSQAGDRSHSPSNPSAKGKEKQGLGETSRAGVHIKSLHEQPLNTGKKVIRGECSKPATSPLGIPPASSSELPDDHPMKQEEGSLLHSAFLVVLAHEQILIEQLVDYLDTHLTPTEKFPDNWWNDLENQLMSNRYFLKRKGLFTICEDLNQPPPKRGKVNKKMEPSVVIGGQDKNAAERPHGTLSAADMPTESEVQERTPPLTLAVRTPRLPKPSDEDIDWTPSMEEQERAAPRGGQRGPSQRQRASEPKERNSSAPLPIATKECAKLSEIFRRTSNALQAELYCDRHVRSSSAPLPIATKRCAETAGIWPRLWGCTRNALQGELYCAPHMRSGSSSAPLPIPIATQECAEQSAGTWRCLSNALQGNLYCAHHSHSEKKKLKKLQK